MVAQQRAFGFAWSEAALEEALYELLKGVPSWPPVVVPFGLDPFGWHGQRESYGDVCAFALEHCTLLPKVSLFPNMLAIGPGVAEVKSYTYVSGEARVRRSELTGTHLFMEEVQTRGDMSWKIRKRWIESEEDLDSFLSLNQLAAPEPDIDAVREKEGRVGDHGLPKRRHPFMSLLVIL